MSDIPLPERILLGIRNITMLIWSQDEVRDNLELWASGVTALQQRVEAIEAVGLRHQANCKPGGTTWTIIEDILSADEPLRIAAAQDKE